MTYNFNEHKHRYAICTAARAVQRSFTTTENIKEAIDATSLRLFCESNEPVLQEEFDNHHKLWCRSIKTTIENKGIPCSYGRAAKIVAIYLKTSVILPTMGNNKKSFVIHPPIDSIEKGAVILNPIDKRTPVIIVENYKHTAAKSGDSLQSGINFNSITFHIKTAHL